VSDAKIEIVFVDSGDSIPPPPDTSPRPKSKPSDTTAYSASDTDANGIDPPAPAGPRKTRTDAPVKEDADKGMEEFFGVLKESGAKIADVFGVGLIYRKIAELIGGITDVVSLFKKLKPGETTIETLRSESEKSATHPVAGTAAGATSSFFKQAAATAAGTAAAHQFSPGGGPTKTGATPGPTLSGLSNTLIATKKVGGYIAQYGNSSNTGGTALTTAGQTVNAMPVAAPAAGPVAGALASLGPFAIAVAGATAAIVAGAVIMKLAFDAIHRQVSEIEGYSPDVGFAAAKSEVRSELATMRRAERIGPDVAGFENTRGRMETKLYDLQTEMLKALLNMYQVIEPLVEVLGVGVDLAAKSLAVHNAISGEVYKIAATDLLGPLKPLIDAYQLLPSIVKDSATDIINTITDNDTEVNDPWMEQWMAIAGGGMPRVPGAGFAPGQLPKKLGAGK
jgi:hypothetical protein